MNLLTRRKAAEMLKVNVATIDNWAKRKIITPLRANDNLRTVRFSEQEIKQLFKNKN